MARKYVWKSPRGLAIAAQVALWVQAALLVLEVPLLLSGSVSLVETEEIGLGTLIYGLLALLYALALITGMVLSALWAFRVTSNARVFRPGMEHGPWAAIYWYVVPIMGWFMPRQIHGEVWDASRGPTEAKGERRLLNLWWGAYVGWNIASGMERVVGVMGNGLPGSGVMVVSAIGALFAAASCVLYTRVVRRITRMQEDKQLSGVFGDTYASQSPLERVTG